MLANGDDGGSGEWGLDGEGFNELCTLSNLSMTSLVMPYLRRFTVLSLRVLLNSASPSLWIELVSLRPMVRLT